MNQIEALQRLQTLATPVVESRDVGPPRPNDSTATAHPHAR
jgi:hypothetical protein